MEIAGFFFPASDDDNVRKREKEWADFGFARHETEVDSEQVEKGNLMQKIF